MSELHGQGFIEEKRLHADEWKDMTKAARKESKKYEKELKDVLEQSIEGQRAWLTNPLMRLKVQRYSYAKRSPLVQDTAASVNLSTSSSEEIDSRGPVQKDQEELTKNQEKELELEKEVQLREAHLKENRKKRYHRDDKRLSLKEFAAESRLLEKKLEAIDLAEKVALEDKSLTEEEKIEIKLKAMTDRKSAHHEYAYLIPSASLFHRWALEKKEETVVKIRGLKKDLEILKMRREGREKEADREQSSKSRHARYDFFRSLRPVGPDVSLSKEDVTYSNPLTGKVMVNTGRAIFGGTKPMYTFQEEGPGGETWLYKEAVNCIGGQTRARAFITSGASKLQRYLCGEDHYVPVFVAWNKEGKAIGSFQKQVDTMQHPTVDLFRWQEKPSGHIDDAVTKQVLREHCLDWVLCNFDTKGENFLQKSDGSLVSIDKEAAFSKLGDKKAEHMSRTEILHKNDTIYNVLFTQFVERPPESGDPLFLDFDSVEEYILKMEALDNEDYLAIFEGYLTQKCGKKSSPATGENKARDKMEQQILARKNGLREEYRQFFSQLLEERLKVIGDNQQAYDEFMKKYTGCFILVDGRIKYEFPAERERDRVVYGQPQGAPVAAPAPVPAVSAETQRYRKMIRQKIRKFDHLETADPTNLYLQEASKWTTEHFTYMSEEKREELTESPESLMERSDEVWLQRAHKICDAYDAGGSEGDGVNQVYHSYYSTMVTEAESVERKDVDGSDRVSHAKKYAKAADGDKAEGLITKDLENLIGNVKKDLAIRFATQPVASDEDFGVPGDPAQQEVQRILSEKAELKYLGTNYLSMMETGFAVAKDKDYADPQQAQKAKECRLSAQLMASYTQYFKTGFSDLGGYAQARLEVKSLLKAKEYLEREKQAWEEKNGEENAYLKKMIEKIDHKLNDAPEGGKSMMERYSAIRQSVLGDAFTDLREGPAVRCSSIGNLMNAMVHERMLAKKDELLRLSGELQTYDRILLKSQQEETAYQAKIEELKTLVLKDDTSDTGDLNYGSEVFCLRTRMTKGESIDPTRLPMAGEDEEQMTILVKRLATKDRMNIQDGMDPADMLASAITCLRTILSSLPEGTDKIPKDQMDLALDAEYVIQLAEKLQRKPDEKPE
ncbi:MAG: hypothetical protein IJT05_05220 [Lachnospiraceae bacterium]|nr:hypothetical protein [Lachnospiraceae bacterium]